MRTVIALAIAASLTACAGDDSMTVGPIGAAAYAKGGGGGSVVPNADVTIAGPALTTPSPQPVTVGSNPLSVRSAPMRSTVIATAFPMRMSLGLTGCVVDPATASSARVTALFSKLVDGDKPRQMDAFIDLARLGQSSSSHSFATHTTEGDFLYTRSVGTFEKLSNASPTVTGSSGVYTFSGGSLKISDRTGGASKHLHIICPNVDEFTLTVVPR
jgi:hypothetical protein